MTPVSQRLVAAAEEIGLSRIYGGIHFLSADLDGLDSGYRLGEYVFQRYLRPLRDPAVLSILQSVSDHRIHVAVDGTTGRNYVLEGSTNLLSWRPIFTNSAPFAFEEADAGSIPARFYRAAAAE